MTAMIEKLLGYLHRVFNKRPDMVLALRVRHATSLTWVVKDGTLTITSPAGTLNVALANYTIGTLRDYLLTQGLLIEYYDTSLASRSALILMDGAGDQASSNGDYLYVYTSLLWAMLGAYGSELFLIRAAITLIPSQMTLPSARDEWLELLGSWYRIFRVSGESDDVYAARIIADVIKPKCNNVAMQDALATRFNLLLSQVLVVDAPLAAYDPVPPSGHTHHYCEFDVEIIPPFSQIDLFDMPPIVRPLRVHGTRLRRIVTKLPSLVPKIAAAILAGENTTIEPYQISEIEASAVVSIAAVMLDFETNIIYPYQAA